MGPLARYTGTVVGLIAGLSAGAVLADRHCYPAQDAYFAARLDLLANGAVCETQIEAASATLRSALFEAEICGCDALILHFRDLVEVGEDGTRDCNDRASTLLNAEAATKAVVLSCH